MKSNLAIEFFMRFFPLVRFFPLISERLAFLSTFLSKDKTIKITIISNLAIEFFMRFFPLVLSDKHLFSLIVFGKANTKH